MITADPKKCGYDAVKDEATILREDADRLKDLTQKLRGSYDKKLIQRTEREFHEQMTQKYGQMIAGEMLFRLWKMRGVNHG